MSSELLGDKIFNDAGFIHPTNSIPQIPAICQVPCWCWGKVLKYQKLVPALENFISIKDGENLKGDILQM